MRPAARPAALDGAARVGAGDSVGAQDLHGAERRPQFVRCGAARRLRPARGVVYSPTMNRDRWAVLLACLTGCGPCGQTPPPQTAAKPAVASAAKDGPQVATTTPPPAAPPTDAGAPADAGALASATVADAGEPTAEGDPEGGFEGMKAAAEATLARLEGKPLDAAGWKQLAGAFAVAEYAEAPEGDEGEGREITGPDGDWPMSKDRAEDSGVLEEGKPPADVAARALALLPEGPPRELAARELTGLRADLSESEPGWLVGSCAHRALDAQGAENQRVVLLAWVSAKRALPIHAAVDEAGELEAFACNRPRDVVDIDGDGTAEIVVEDGYHEGASLSIWQLESGKWVQRWSGGGGGL